MTSPRHLRTSSNKILCALVVLLSIRVTYARSELNVDDLIGLSFVSLTPRSLQVLDGDVVTNILERKNKDVWISTTDKIYRFDGNKLSNISVSSRANAPFPHSQFESILETATGHIFLTSYDGTIYRFSDKLDAFLKVYDSAKRATELSSSHIDQEDNLWLGYADGSIGKLNLVLGAFSEFEGRTDQRIIGILSDTDYLYFVDRDGQVQVARAKTGATEAITRCKGPPSPFTSAMLETERQILIGTRGYGVWRAKLTPEGCELERAFDESVREAATATVHDINQSTIGDSKISIISTDTGVFVTQADRVLVHLNRKTSRIATNEVIVARHVGGLTFWLGTYVGVNIFKMSNIELITDFPDNTSPSIVATTTSPKLGTFVADYQHVYRIAYPSTDLEMEQIHLPPTPGAGIMSMTAGTENVWIGFRNGNLLKLDPRTRNHANVSHDENNLALPPISSIYVKNEDYAYVGTYGGGVYVFEHNGIRRFDQDKSELHKNVLNIKRLRGIGIVGLTEGGVIFLESDGEKKNSALERLSDFHALPIWSIDENDESIWLVTPKNGIYVQARDFSRNWRDSLSQVLPDHLMEELIFYEVRLGANDTAYLSSNRGIFAADLGGKIRRILHGIDSNPISFDFGVAGQDSEGNTLFGGTGGIVKIGAQASYSANDLPSMALTNIYANGEKVYFSDNNAQQASITLDYPLKVLNAEYSAIDFSSPQGFKYRYKLHPFDPDWIDGGNYGAATYTNIPPGDYVFEVQGADSAGVWNTEGISLNLRVLPPPWQTWWAYCIYAFGIGFALYIIKNWYDANVLRHRADEIARERTQAVDAALDEMQEQLEAQDQLVCNVRRYNEGALTFIRDMLEHRADHLSDEFSLEIMYGSGKRVHAMAILERSLKYFSDRLLVDLNAFTADCLSQLSDEADSTQGITTINEVTDQLIPADNGTLIAILIYELTSNVFYHAFNEKRHGKYLRISMTCSHPSDGPSITIQLKVQDNGVGIPEGVVGDQPGLGLVQQIVQRFDGDLTIASAEPGTSVAITLQLPGAEKDSSTQ